MDTKKFPAVQADVEQLVYELSDYLTDNKYEVIKTNDRRSTTLQASTPVGKLRDWTGFSQSMTIRLVKDEDGTDVSVGNQNWTNKILSSIFLLVVGVGLSLFTGGLSMMLLPLPAYGAYLQSKNTRELWLIVNKHMARKAAI